METVKREASTIDFHLHHGERATLQSFCREQEPLADQYPPAAMRVHHPLASR